MIRFELKLLTEQGSSEADEKTITTSNAVAQHAFNHLKKLIGKRKCRKHPSSPNKLRIYAVKGGEPRAEVISYCCPEFLKLLK